MVKYPEAWCPHTGDGSSPEKFIAWSDKTNKDLLALDCGDMRSKVLTIRYWHGDVEVYMKRHNLCYTDLINYRSRSGFTAYHAHQYEDMIHQYEGGRELAERLEKIVGDVGTLSLQEPMYDGAQSDERHSAGNTCLTIAALLHCLKKHGVCRDIRALVGRAVYETRFHYKWTTGPWRTHVRVWPIAPNRDQQSE